MSHIFQPKSLRAYDIRGIIGEDLNEIDAYWIGRGFGHKVKQSGGKSVAVGRDGRLSSPKLTEHLIQGLIESGCEVFFIGLSPSPMLYFAEYHLDTDAALMITGSHNPPEYNGFKMSLGKSSFYGDHIVDLAKDVQVGHLSEGAGALHEVDITTDYINRIVKDFPTDFSSKVVWDPGNGAGAHIVSQLAKQLPGTHHVINGQVDGTFPAHHPDPTVPENLIQLIDEVKKQEADMGLALDGDADRIGAVDSQGRIFWGDQILLLLARDILKSHPKATIIADVKASNALFEDVAVRGGKPLMWKTGHSHIKTKMKETGAKLAGEMSGHIFIADDYYGFDDGIYSGLRLLKMIHNSGQSPAHIHAGLPQTYATNEIRIPCCPERKFAVCQDLSQLLRKQGIPFSDIDGVRANQDNGWWLLRASNTQDEIIVRCEGSDPIELNNMIDDLVTHMQSCAFDTRSIALVQEQKVA